MPAANSTLLAIGNPAHMVHYPPTGGEPIPQDDLPWADIEARYVAQQFTDSRVLCGDEATAVDVRPLLSSYRLLHFATHGVLSEEAPLHSSILLANGQALSLYELMGQQLDADLVVLSACDTGVGVTTGGDDVLGLMRGLLGADAHAAVVSLWPINDASASLLMSQFYGFLRERNAPARALQQAQNYLRTLSPKAIEAELKQMKEKVQKAGGTIQPIDNALKKLRHGAVQGSESSTQLSKMNGYAHPFHWAPFILVG